MCENHRELGRAGQTKHVPLSRPLLRNAVAHTPEANKPAKLQRPQRLLVAPERPVHHDIATVRDGQKGKAKALLDTKTATPEDPTLKDIPPEMRAFVQDLRRVAARPAHKKRRR